MSYDLHSAILLSSLVSAASGVQSEVKIRGSKEEVEAMLEVIEATKAFKQALAKSNLTLTEVNEVLGRRQRAASDFYRVTGLAWPL